MLGFDWNLPAMDEMLGFGISVLTLLMTLGIAAWFAHSLVESLMRMGRYVRRSNYEALLRENERLRSSLMDAREENDYLWKLYRTSPLEVEERHRDAA